MTITEQIVDIATATRILHRVTHSQRFPVGRLVPPVGILPSSVRGLEELALALRPEPQALAGANLERLADWIEREVGDAVCADQVRLVTGEAPSYVEACLGIHGVIAARVAAARAVLDAAAQDGRLAGDSGRE